VATTAKRTSAGQARPAAAAKRARRELDLPDVTIITGLSGAGRSEAAKSLEDLGYFVVDNLPPALIGKMAELATIAGGPSRVAIVVDVRGGVFFAELSQSLGDLGALNVPYRIVFLEASDEDLVRRFELDMDAIYVDAKAIGQIE